MQRVMEYTSKLLNTRRLKPAATILNPVDTFYRKEHNRYIGGIDE